MKSILSLQDTDKKRNLRIEKKKNLFLNRYNIIENNNVINESYLLNDNYDVNWNF